MQDQQLGPAVFPEDYNQFVKSIRILSSEFGHGKVVSPLYTLLMDLYETEKSGQLITVSGLGLSYSIAQSTMLRHLGTLIEHGWAMRADHPKDKRASFVRITPTAKAKLDRVFS